MTSRNIILAATSLLTFGALTLAGGGFVAHASDAAATQTQDATADKAQTADQTQAESTAEAVSADPAKITEMSMGNPDAKVTVIEYASYTCPHCATFDQGPMKQLKADFIDTGKINFIFREVYFDRFGLWASMVARCGGEQKFFGITDLIFKTQSEWVRAGEPAAIVEELRKIGRLAGIGNDTLDACLKDPDRAQALVSWYEENSAEDNITSTPSFIINGEKHTNMPYAEMKDLIDAALEE